MKVNSIKVLEMCIENGTKLGIQRAFKHNDSPSTEVIENYVIQCITDEVFEWFDMDNSNDTYR
jgi:hypothetical protein